MTIQEKANQYQKDLELLKVIDNEVRSEVNKFPYSKILGNYDVVDQAHDEFYYERIGRNNKVIYSNGDHIDQELPF